MAHRLVELSSLSEYLLVGLLKVVGFENVGRVFFASAAGKDFVHDEQQSDDSHVYDEGMDLPGVQEVVVNDRKQPENGEEEEDKLDKNASNADSCLLFVEKLSGGIFTMKTKLRRSTQMSIYP